MAFVIFAKSCYHSLEKVIKHDTKIPFTMAVVRGFLLAILYNLNYKANGN